MTNIIYNIAGWLETIRTNYNVNPYIFAVLYLGGAPVFWYCVYKILFLLKTGKQKEIIKWVVILVIATIAPFIYVMLFGRNLPGWFWFLVAGLLLFTVISTFRRFKKRINP